MKMKSVKNVIMVMVLTVLAFLYVGTTKTNAQITDEKDIPKGYTPIYTIEDLYGINNNLKGNYILMADIDMSETAEGRTWDFGNGWKPIASFGGVFDGNGHRIINLCIYGTIMEKNKRVLLGLFGANSGTICNLGVENIDINVSLFDGLIGGIAASNSGSIFSCYANGSIKVNDIDVNNLSLEDKKTFLYYYDEVDYYYYYDYYYDYDDDVVDEGFDDWVANYNFGKIDSDFTVSGIACGSGSYYGALIKDCYSAIEIESDDASGLCNGNVYDFSNCYSLSNVNGDKSSPIGSSSGKNIYFLKDLGVQKGKGITALSSAQMKLQGCYTGFDFDKVWFIDKNSSYPYPQLRSCPQVRIESVKVSSKPNKTSYGVKDDLDLTGATLVVNYEDNYSVEVPIDKSMCSYKMTKGIQTVTVDYYGAKASFDIEVGMEKEVLTVTSQTSNMVVGESFGFAADYNGSESIQFSSSNPKVLSINKKTGDAKAIKVGTAVVTISAGSLKKEIEVTVSKTADEGKTGKETKENKKPETITEDTVEPDFEMEIGESFKLAIKKIKSRNLASSDVTVVTINEKGKVVAVAPGVATITATDKKTNKVAESYVILVVGEEEPDFEIEVNESVRIAMKKGYTAESSNEKYVTVSKKGIIFGAKAGTATITVYDKMGKEVDKYIVLVTK